MLDVVYNKGSITMHYNIVYRSNGLRSLHGVMLDIR